MSPHCATRCANCVEIREFVKNRLSGKCRRNIFSLCFLDIISMSDSDDSANSNPQMTCKFY